MLLIPFMIFIEVIVVLLATLLLLRLKAAAVKAW